MAGEHEGAMVGTGEPTPQEIAGQEPLSMIRMNRKPAAVLAEAKEAATALMEAVRANDWAVEISGREHLRVEAWQTCGMFYGLTARVTDVREVVLGDARGFKAKAVVVHAASGKVLSAGEMYCMNDEDKWSTRAVYEWDDTQKKRVKTNKTVPVPMFQLASMAETRAVSKALRNCLSWVVVLAGYDPTPAEEAEGGLPGAGGPTAPQPTRASASPGAQGKTLMLNLDAQGLALTGKATFDLKGAIAKAGGKQGKTADGNAFAWRFPAEPEALNKIRGLAKQAGVTLEEAQAVGVIGGATRDEDPPPPGDDDVPF